MMRLPALKLGNLTVLRPSVGLAPTSQGSTSSTKMEDGIIGVPVLRRTHMIIDYSRSRIILDPVDRLDLPDTVDASGISLIAEHRPSPVFRVAHVVTLGPEPVLGFRRVMSS